MSMSDTIADSLTRIRNAIKSRHSLVILPQSKTVYEIVKILKEEGYLEDFITKTAGGRPEIHIALKYGNSGAPAIRKLEKKSVPGRRVYCGKETIPNVLGGLGIAVISTSKGVLSSKTAKKLGLGGEVICTVY